MGARGRASGSSGVLASFIATGELNQTIISATIEIYIKNNYVIIFRMATEKLAYLKFVFCEIVNMCLG